MMVTIDKKPIGFDPWLDSTLADDIWQAVHRQAVAYQAMPHAVESTEALGQAERDVEEAVQRLVNAAIMDERERCARGPQWSPNLSDAPVETHLLMRKPGLEFPFIVKRTTLEDGTPVWEYSDPAVQSYEGIWLHEFEQDGCEWCPIPE